MEHISDYDKLKEELDKISRGMYYYNQTLASFKETLRDPAQIETEATMLMQKFPTLYKYMLENCIHAAFYTPKAPDNLKGLYTRDMVNKLMKDQMRLTGTDCDKIIDDCFKEAREEMDKLKQQAAGKGDVFIPGFKPHGKKTRILWQCFEIGTVSSMRTIPCFLQRETSSSKNISYHQATEK